MSAESKKKRGEAGQSNAKSIPFRYHGYPRGYRLDTTMGGTTQFPGSRFLVAMITAATLPGFAPSDRMYAAADAAMDLVAARKAGKSKVHKEK